MASICLRSVQYVERAVLGANPAPEYDSIRNGEAKTREPRSVDQRKANAFDNYRHVVRMTHQAVRTINNSTCTRNDDNPRAPLLAK